MDDLKYDEGKLRFWVYAILVAIGLGIAGGRIANVISKEGDTAFLSANDRSRWCTVASLVHKRSYEIDWLINYRNEKKRRPWYTIDLVRHRGNDGQQHYYSSKVPLFPTMVAGVYWCIYQATGMTITQQPIYVTRIVLALVNLPLLAIFYCCTIGAIEKIATKHWSRMFVAAATCFGTMMMPFAIALNNHLVAAASAAVALYVYSSSLFYGFDREIAEGESLSPQKHFFLRWLIAGAAATFCFINELPALSMLSLWCLLVLLHNWRAVLPFGIGIVIVAAAFLGTNLLAHDSPFPPYAHRSNGALLGSVQAEVVGKPQPEDIAGVIASEGFTVDADNPLTVSPSGKSGRWVATTADQHQFAVLADETETNWLIHHWDDWYDYPNSYWRGNKRRGVDLGEPSRLTYALNMTFGHYGIFSLTPIWLLVPVGFVVGFSLRPSGHRNLVVAITLATLVCAVFYVMRPEIDRNYGGVSSCFRWMLWFAPLWLAVLTPVVDYLQENANGRALVVVLLALSAGSMAVSLSSPWQHPWIYRFMSFLGWIAT